MPKKRAVNSANSETPSSGISTAADQRTELNAQATDASTVVGFKVVKRKNRQAIVRTIVHVHKAVRLTRTSPFKMPGRDTLHTRQTTINMAFAKSLTPVLKPTQVELDVALALLGMEDGIKCSYCGGAYQTWDHFQAATQQSKPSGFIDEIDNLVPCCSRCNSSRGNRKWTTFMKYLEDEKVEKLNAVIAALPKGKHSEDANVETERLHNEHSEWLAQHKVRQKRLCNFSEAVDPIRLDFNQLFFAGPLKEHYDDYSKLYAQISDLLSKAKTHWEALVPVIDEAARNADEIRTDGKARKPGLFLKDVPPKKSLRSAFLASLKDLGTLESGELIENAMTGPKGEHRPPTAD
ncbi:HNH endonuclease [Paraburkholderia sp.]|nr:HNH endonuclease [Paraburkholderia sp.]